MGMEMSENGEINPIEQILPNLFQKLLKGSLSSLKISEFEAPGSSGIKFSRIL